MLSDILDFCPLHALSSRFAEHIRRDACRWTLAHSPRLVRRDFEFGGRHNSFKGPVGNQRPRSKAQQGKALHWQSRPARATREMVGHLAGHAIHLLADIFRELGVSLRAAAIRLPAPSSARGVLRQCGKIARGCDGARSRPSAVLSSSAFRSFDEGLHFAWVNSSTRPVVAHANGHLVFRATGGRAMRPWRNPKNPATMRMKSAQDGPHGCDFG